MVISYVGMISFDSIPVAFFISAHKNVSLREYLEDNPYGLAETCHIVFILSETLASHLFIHPTSYICLLADLGLCKQDY